MKHIATIAVLPLALFVSSCEDVSGSAGQLFALAGAVAEAANQNKTAKSTSSSKSNSANNLLNALSGAGASSSSLPAVKANGAYTLSDYIAVQNSSINALDQLGTILGKINNTATANLYAPQVKTVVQQYQASRQMYQKMGKPTGTVLEQFKNYTLSNQSRAESVMEKYMGAAAKMGLNGHYQSNALMNALYGFSL